MQEIQSIIRTDFKILYPVLHQIGKNLEAVRKFLDIYYLQDQVSNLNRFISPSKTEAIIKGLPPPLKKKK